MAGFDFDRAVRWARLGEAKQVVRRPDHELPFAHADRLAGRQLLLDTSVYVHQLQGKAPKVVADLIDARTVNHSSVAIQELMHAVGVLDPVNPGTKAVIASIGKLVRAMPDHRTFAPDLDVLGRAAILSGVLCRFQKYRKDRRSKALMDCVLFLQALKMGAAVLTANVGDFDLLLQMVPSGRALFYRSG